MKPKVLIPTAIIASTIVGALVFVGTRDEKTGAPDPVTVNGQTISFPYTDEKDRECLGIYTNQEAYTDGFSQATMYLAVVNDCGEDQNVELAGYFIDDKRQITDISVLAEVPDNRIEPIIEERCEKTATQTICAETRVGSTVVEGTKLEFVPLRLIERTAQEFIKEETALLKKQIARKDVGEYDAKRKSSPFFLPTDGVLYYRVVVQFPPNTSTNMRIEVVGSAGGYGFLN